VSRKNVRTLVQAASLVLIFLIPFLNRKGITAIAGTLYSLAVGPVWITDPVIGVQTILATMSLDTKLLLSILIPGSVALTWGRVFCSWICPQNMISELFDALAEKTGIKRLFNPVPSPIPRFAVLAVALLATLSLKFPVVSLLSAPGIISVQAANLVYDAAVGAELGLIVMIALFELFIVRRIWCNHVCPVGGFLVLLRFKRTMKVTFSKSEERPCDGCGVCVETCRLGLDPMGKKLYPLCHNCGDCIAACEGVKGSANPLRFTF